MFPAVMTSAFSSSMQMSIPGDFPVFICFIAWVTSCSVGTPVAISRSSLGAGGSAVMVGASVLRTLVKCSAHRLACIWSVVSAFPSLSLTMLAATLVCLQSCFVILCTVLSSLFCAAVSAFLQACQRRLSCPVEHFSLSPCPCYCTLSVSALAFS